jgi:plasmid rolling circle replication initiator protein Rep
VAGSEAKSGLDTPERLFTSIPPLPDRRNPEIGRIAGKRQRVERVLDALSIATGAGHPFSEVVEGWIGRMQDCGDNLTWQVCPDGHQRRLRGAHFCQTRACPICAWRRSLKGRHRLMGLVKYAHQQGDHVLFLTLTLANSPTIDGQVDRIWKAYGKLRRRKLWKERVQAAFARIETTWKPAEGYHVHMHLLIAVPRISWRRLQEGARTFDKDEIERAWREITGDSYITRVKGLKDRLVVTDRHRKQSAELRAEGIRIKPALIAAADELAKYPVKEDDFLGRMPEAPDPETGELWSTDHGAALAWVDLLAECHGRKLSQVTGYWRGMAVEEDLTGDEEAAVWIGELEGPGLEKCPDCGVPMWGEYYRRDNRGYYIAKRGPWSEFQDVELHPERAGPIAARSSPPRPGWWRAAEANLHDITYRGAREGVSVDQALTTIRHLGDVAARDRAGIRPPLERRRTTWADD